MNEQNLKKKSKFLSWVLRHQPETIGIELDEAGWVEVDVLMAALTHHGRGMSRETLQTVVETNDKQRFSFNDDGTRIRANQGHSIEIELGYEPAVPPDLLYHGTPSQSVEAIRQGGLKKMKRHHVHLHLDIATSTAVGQRRGKPMLLVIKAGKMHRLGHDFFVTPNHVWLTDNVPAEFIRFPE